MPEEKDAFIGALMAAAKPVIGKAVGSIGSKFGQMGVAGVAKAVGANVAMDSAFRLGQKGLNMMKKADEYNSLVSAVAQELKKMAADEKEAAYQPFKPTGMAQSSTDTGEKAMAEWQKLKANKPGKLIINKVTKPGEATGLGGLISKVKSGLGNIFKNVKP